jgi:hypothetical protein
MGLGGVVLLALLSIPARIILRKRLVPIPSPKLPPSGAAPWRRTRAGGQLDQFASFNAMPTVADVPSNAWHNGQVPGVHPLVTPPFIPTINGYAGLTQSPQPFPTTPPLVPSVQAEQERRGGQGNSHMWHNTPFANTSQSLDSANTGARKKLRRNGLRATDAEPAFPEELSGELSADMQVLSDPYLQAMIQRYSQKGQAIKQSPGEAP